MNIAVEFHILTGLLALLGTVLLIWHMNIAWPNIVKTGQRMRYITLLWFAMAVAFASAENLRIHRLIESPAIMLSMGCILLITTMIVSIRESRRNPR